MPEALLAHRAALEQRLSTDAPHGELPVEQERWDGERVREAEAAEAARGRAALSAGAVHEGRLGALAKAAVLRDPAATLAEVPRVTTYKSESNRPMVAVNEALGFVVAGELSTWSLPVGAVTAGPGRS